MVPYPEQKKKLYFIAITETIVTITLVSLDNYSPHFCGRTIVPRWGDLDVVNSLDLLNSQ